MGLVELINMLDMTFSIISCQRILFLDGLPSIRTRGSKLPSLHPALLRECIEGAIVTEF